MHFEDYLHPEFIRLIEQIQDQGFKIGVVGGTVRDYFLGRENKHDYDCELRYLESNADAKKAFDNLKFEKNIMSTKLAYEVIKLEHSEFSCELTLPRVEIYSEDFSHSNFDAIFNNDLEHRVAVSRRDFTINAMMYEFNSHWEFIDPLNGKKDLEAKLLKVCSDDFFKDPVRFLRAIRFSMTLGFQIEDKILEHFKKLRIDYFAAHYLRKEAIKSGRPLCFIFKLMECLDHPLSSKFSDYICQHEVLENNLRDHLKGIIFLEPDVRDKIYETFDFSFNVNGVRFPIEYKKICEQNFEEFCAYDERYQILSTHKAVLRLGEKQFLYLTQNSLIDLSYQELHQLQKIKVDLSRVSNEQKALYQLYQRVRQYFEQ